MELKDFISETIRQITDGIIEGDKYVKEHSKNTEGVRNQYTKINFDVGVTTNEEEKGKVGGKVSVIQIFNVGASTENATNVSNYNRIQFDLLIHVKTQK